MWWWRRVDGRAAVVDGPTDTTLTTVRPHSLGDVVASIGRHRRADNLPLHKHVVAAAMRPSRRTRAQPSCGTDELRRRPPAAKGAPTSNDASGPPEFMCGVEPG